MGRWTGQDNATLLGGLRACVRVCVREGVAEISMRMRASCCCSCRDWEAKYFALHMSGLGRGGKVMRAGKMDWRRRGTTAPIAVYCSPAAACTLSNRARWSFFGFQLVCAADAAALEREDTKEASKQASFYHQRRQTPSQYHSSPPALSIPPAHLLRPLARGALRTDRQASPPNAGKHAAARCTILTGR